MKNITKYVNLENGKKLTYVTAIGVIPGSIFLLAVYVSMKKIKEQHNDFNKSNNTDLSLKKWLIDEGGSKQVINTIKFDVSTSIKNSRSKLSNSLHTINDKLNTNISFKSKKKSKPSE